MNEKAKKYLSDIISAIDLINDFMTEIDDFNQYDTDLKTQSAIERQLGIIGEAANKLQKEYLDYALENSKQIIGFRNRLIHAYDSIDNSIVWVILKKHLIPLKRKSKNFNKGDRNFITNPIYIIWV